MTPSVASETELSFTAPDGWPLRAILRMPSESPGEPMPSVVMVPDSFHERDVYESLARNLGAAGLISLRMDIRGRGASRGATPYARMSPLQKRRVSSDVGSALDHMALLGAADSGRLALICERNTAPDAIVGAGRLAAAVVVLGGWPADRMVEALERRPVPVFGLVSAEDRLGLRGTTDAYLAGREDGRLDVLHGRGFGTTMFSTGRGGELSLEQVVTAWLGETLR